ncbi:MAG: hypothetical protein K9L64_06590, partial [Candidatus Izimaplasma sp.]|nr:hypothetical protein [Candidatus Izimaplasma bacterium]
GSILFDAFDSEYDQMRAYVVEASGEVVYNYYLNYFSTSMEWTISDNEYVALDDTYYINLTYTDAAYFVNIIIEPSFDYENATEIYIFLIPGESNTGGDFPTGDLVTLDDIGYAPRYDGSFLIDGYDEGDYKYRVYVSQDNPQLIYDMYYGYYNGDSTWSINDYGYDSESEIGYLSMSNNVDLSNIVIYIEPSYEYTDAWDIEIQYILYTNTTGDFPLEDTVTFADISVAPRYPGSVLIEGDDSEYLGEYSSYRVYLSQDDFESIYNMYYNLYDSDSTWTIDYSYSDPVYGEGYLILENTGDMSTIYIDIYPSYDYADTWEIVIDYLY